MQGDSALGAFLPTLMPEPLANVNTHIFVLLMLFNTVCGFLTMMHIDDELLDLH